MAKDPAFLFYPNDFMSGTQFFTDEQTGKYIRLLCAQHQHGRLSEKHMLIICKSYDEEVFSKFEIDEHGNYYNERLEQETLRRKMYCESRASNRKSSNKKKKHMKNISKSYDPHMETETVTRNITINTSSARKSKKFTPPTQQELIDYFAQNGYKKEAAIKAWKYYEANNWRDSSDKPVKAWKQKMQGVWFREEHLREQNKQYSSKPTLL